MSGLFGRDLTNPRWIHAKGWMFLLVGALASAGLLAERPTVRTALLLAAAVWGFARFYYYAFYVIEKYVDARYRFDGLISFARYWLRHGPVAAPREPNGSENSGNANEGGTPS